MKRIAVLLVVLLAGLSFYGCGSNGSTASSNGSSSTSNPGGGPPLAFTLNLVDNAARFISAGTGTTWTPTDVRVVIRRYDTVASNITICTNVIEDPNGSGDTICTATTTTTVYRNTEVYKDIQDVPFASSVSVGIPGGSGYTLDVIASVLTAPSGTHSILKYGQASNVTVAANASATVTMNPVFTILNMTLADPVVSKGKFVVTLNNALPFDPGYRLTMTFNSIIDATTNTPPATMIVTAATNTNTFTAPASFSTGGTIALQGQFGLNNAFLTSADTPAKWTRLFPDATYGEQVYTNLSPLITVIVPMI